jgi:N-acetylglucosaminyldiphosphoundecaprenol N-acetyl-beta-D-mannosaminyltransferase
MTTQPDPGQRSNLFGVPIDALTMDQAVARIAAAIEGRTPLHIGVVNAAKLVNMRRDPELRASVLESDVIFADGMSVVWASRLLGCPLPERVAGIDLMYAMLRLADRRGYRVACLGAEEGVLRRTVDYIREHYPGARVVASRNGYFSSADEPAVAAEIAAAKPDMLFVAMTSPKKENFLARWNGLIAVPVSHGVGGSFDVVAGKVQRAPELWQRLGLEWLYRVKQEPLRLWRRYTVTNTQFIAMVLREMFGRRASSPRPNVDVVGAGAPRR